MTSGYHTGQWRAGGTPRILELVGWLVPFTSAENTKRKIWERRPWIQDGQVMFQVKTALLQAGGNSSIPEVRDSSWTRAGGTFGSFQHGGWAAARPRVPSLPEHPLGLCLSCHFLPSFSLPKSHSGLRSEIPTNYQNQTASLSSSAQCEQLEIGTGPPLSCP